MGHVPFLVPDKFKNGGPFRIALTFLSLFFSLYFIWAFLGLQTTPEKKIWDYGCNTPVVFEFNYFFNGLGYAILSSHERRQLFGII